jgi:DNA-binding NarL/FixJ family response regulator
MINILIGEDHKILRDGIKSLLLHEDDLKVVAEAANGKEVIDILSTGVHIDILLLDINMPVMNGQECSKYVSEHFPKVNVLVLSMMEHENYIYSLLKAGVKGYLLKNTGREELLFSIRKLYNNGYYICSELMLNILRKNMEAFVKTAEAPKVTFSKRELEVFQLISEGLTTGEISEKIYTSKRTVETHRMNLIEKTGSKNTAQLVKYGIMHGLIK